MQNIYCNTEKAKKNGPDEILYDIRNLLDKYFPENKFNDTYVKNYNETIDIPREDIPLRIVMGQYALNEVVNKINQRN